MPTEYIAFDKTNYFSSLICDYLDEKKELKPFYNRFPSIENFKAQIEEKRNSGTVSEHNRNLLVEALKKQYKNVDASSKTLENIEQVKLQNTFTITTGHQLNLFTGPLYFLYKIVSTINLASQLKKEYPAYHFVPVYWMATEDHDFEEINYFNFKGKKVQWNRDASGAVGELTTEGLDEVFEVFAAELGSGKHADTLRNLFQSAYLKHTKLADATLYLANALFSAYGLVIIDANTKSLKQLFVPFIEEELENQTSYKNISETNTQLESLKNVNKVQVNPRELNIFYLKENLRERLVLEEGVYKVLNTDITWSKQELIKHLKEEPQCFSPNVIMRPLYQEVILPNLCYVGGGGELAYWLQLKSYFSAVHVPFPILSLRNSVLIKTEKQTEKLKRLNLTNEDIFLKQEVFINKKTKQISNIDIDFSVQLKYLKQQFKDLYLLAEKTDKSFIGAVAAQEKKQIVGLRKLEKRLLKAQKRKLEDEIKRMTEMQNTLFPNANLQERNTNFSELFLENGENLIPKLIEELKPLKYLFTVLSI